MTERFYVGDASFQPDQPCICGSGRRFAECCGNPSPHRPPPAGVFVVNNFLSPQQCQDFIAFAEQQQQKPLKVYDEEASGDGQMLGRLASYRKTETVDITPRKDELVGWVRDAYVHVVQQIFNTKVVWFEVPCVLRYGIGGLYASHADAENVDHEANCWYRGVDRDVSVVMYLNDDYVGGGIRFNRFNYTYQPRAGDLVIFPSNNAYLHESLPVESGVKYALVSWGVVSGTPRVQAPPHELVFID